MVEEFLLCQKLSGQIQARFNGGRNAVSPIKTGV